MATTLSGYSKNSRKDTPSTRELEAAGHRVLLIGETSPGVRRIEMISSEITNLDRVFLFIGVFILAFAYSLDGSLRVITYQPEATAAFGEHSYLAAINTVVAVVGAAAQPACAKVSDIIGRLELVLVSVVLYVLGTIIQGTAHCVQVYGIGAILYNLGYIAIVLLVEVIVADVTSLRSRVFFAYVPALPFLLNAFLSGNVAMAVLDVTTWRWGIGMWAIVYPVCALPLVLALFVAQHRAKKRANLVDHPSPFQLLRYRNLSFALFWQLDVAGMVFLVAALTLTLTPLTLAEGDSKKWASTATVLPLVLGVLFIPTFVFWERVAPHPMIPFKGTYCVIQLLRDSSVWGALGIAVTFNMAFNCQADFLYTVLRVSFDQTDLSATRIANLYSFASVITGPFVGLAVYKVRHLKPFVMAGTFLYFGAFILLIVYRGGNENRTVNGVIGAQLLLGVAGGLFPYPTLASIQAATNHNHLAIITGLYLAMYRIGGALGNCISGTIWTNVLYNALQGHIESEVDAQSAYASPLSFIHDHNMSHPARQGMVVAYKNMQRILCIVGLIICVPLVGFTYVLKNPRLGQEQSLPTAEVDESHTNIPENNGLGHTIDGHSAYELRSLHSDSNTLRSHSNIGHSQSDIVRSEDDTRPISRSTKYGYA
ncbi:siderophore iron transporter 1 [Lindgomyces ingoldianus]|uniref:Siderophore iron transporter 1 n=1 Tax=Lindgomyces ingoldianus TaxID=673940 RepID=A0ACB6R4P8_9PLEO|nr:siderophore iron transporter 1 [Lindgomyces ingoldianus]KAF2473285.1 siderophore iron transporter 1 [Lindgomyces ingoldianus]